MVGRIVSICAVGTAILSAMLVAEANGITFSDSTFNDADWSTHEIHTGTFGSYTTTQQSTGGNPDEVRFIGHNDFSETVSVFHALDGAVYDPSVQGAIIGMEFFVDARAILSLNSINVAIQSYLRQDGIDYVGPGFVPSSAGAWEHYESLDLHAGIFGDIFAPGTHPDFSASGSVIQFGFISSNNNTGVFASRSVGVDNWEITINPEECILGDTDGDEDVDFDDFLSVQNFFGDGGPDSPGDADCDGDCDFDDFLAVNNFFGTEAPVMTFVPEPAGISLLSMGAVALLARRR